MATQAKSSFHSIKNNKSNPEKRLARKLNDSTAGCTAVMSSPKKNQ